jgi:hypothetical protein
MSAVAALAAVSGAAHLIEAATFTANTGNTT